MQPVVLSLSDPEAGAIAHAGGKACRLSALARAGFPVPRGFVIPTGAYREHLRAAGIDAQLRRLLEDLDAEAARGLEAATAQLREAIVAAPLADTARDAILRAYRGLGESCYVAVRSSAIAEDLATASFAGQHDTYLDVHGDAQLLGAVKRCWASLWTARAVAYRQRQGLDPAAQALAVLVLEMVPAESSGVLFTANPLTSATDEFLVDAAWGLGEGIVSGLVNPDQFVIDRASGTVKRRVLGSKQVRVVRASAAGGGTMQQPVPEAERQRFTLADAQVAELADLGRRVSAHFGDWPQDIEWARADGRFVLLQSRDVTGVEFSWDQDLELHGTLPRLPDEAVLSRARSDTVWTGRITPLFYSLRAETRTLVTPMVYRIWAGSLAAQRRWGRPGTPIGQLRWYKYHRGAVYFNSEVEYRNHLQYVPPALRSPVVCEWTPPEWLTDFREQPGSWWRMPWIAARIAVLSPGHRIDRVFETLARHISANRGGTGPDPAALRAMDDAALKRQVDETLRVQSEWVRDIAHVFYLYAPYMTSAMFWMLEHWYAKDWAATYDALITGAPRQTWTVRQNEALRALAAQIRACAALRQAFDASDVAGFFVQLRGSEEGRRFLADYQAFVSEFGHRGHADRDIWYPRRLEDPALDRQALALLLKADARRPATSEEDRVAARQAATQAVAEALRGQRFGRLKAWLFERVQQFLVDFQVFRDDSRHQTDRNTFAKKLAVVEVGRRVFERGLLEREDDFYYLSKAELFELLDGRTARLRLMRAKVAARRLNCERYRVEWSPPMYIRGDATVHEDAQQQRSTQHEPGLLQGLPMSRGEVVGRARVVRSLAGLQEVRQGEILVARSTDPGWTPVFYLISGLVLETGGALAHGACLAREYGLPAVQLADAMNRIADGAIVAVDGRAGTVRVLQQPPPAPAPQPEAEGCQP